MGSRESERVCEVERVLWKGNPKVKIAPFRMSGCAVINDGSLRKVRAFKCGTMDFQFHGVIVHKSVSFAFYLVLFFLFLSSNSRGTLQRLWLEQVIVGKPRLPFVNARKKRRQFRNRFDTFQLFHFIFKSCHLHKNLLLSVHSRR